MNDVHGNIFCLYCTKTNGCVHQTFCCIAWMSRGRPHSLARNAPAAVKSSKGNQAHSTSIFMSYLHLHDLYTTLSESCIPFQTNRHALSHRKGVCVCVCDGEPQPPPHQSKSGQHWPLWGSLRQYSLSYETGKHMCPLCGIACVPKGGAAMWDVLTAHGHLHALSDWWRLEVIHLDEEWTMDSGQTSADG